MDGTLLSLRGLPAGLIKDRWIQLFLAIFALLEVYNHAAIPAFISTQKGIETRAIADNAALRQKAEAEQAEWKAITETQIATYAARKQRADARKATADARKAEAEQIIARETARNSEVKARADAEATEGEAAIKEQQVIVERERANQAHRLSQAQATEAEYKAIFATMANWIANSDAKPNVTCSIFGNGAAGAPFALTDGTGRKPPWRFSRDSMRTMAANGSLCGLFQKGQSKLALEPFP